MRPRFLTDMDTKAVFTPDDLARWSGGTWLHAPEGRITGFSIDTRTLKPGDLFVAVRGEKHDGHDHVVAALSGGASAALVESREVVHGQPAPVLVVESVRRALLDIARGYRRTLDARMVAVTGSVGKTTVKELIADMTQHIGVTARTRGNWNNDLGLPLSILSALPETKYGIFEVGMNHPGELAPLCEVLAPDISVVTCVGPVHIEHFENEAGIAMEKATVYRALGPEGIAVLNLDDAYADMMMKDIGARRVLTVSARPGADYAYRRLDPAQGTFVITERSSGEQIECQAALPGDYFVMDAVLAAAVARALGAGWPAIVSAVRHYQPLSMRWNRHHVHGVLVINDAYNANPVSVRAAARAMLEEPATGERWLVLGGMLELGPQEESMHRELGAFVARCGRIKLLAVGVRGAWIAAGAVDAGMPADACLVEADAASAARRLLAVLREGDTVLYKASRGEAVDRVFQSWKELKAAAGA